MHQQHITFVVKTHSSPPSLIYLSSLTFKLLDAVIPFPRDERQRHNARDVHLRPKNVHAEIELLTHSLDILETFLIVRSCASDPDFDVVLVEQRSNFAEGADDAFECACDLVIGQD